MNETQYTLLFRVECLHRYFGGACLSLVFKPTEHCRALLLRYGMLFRTFPGGCAVYATVESPPDRLLLFDETAPFTFTLISTEPALDSYTEFGARETVAPSDGLFYFDNTSDQRAEAFGGQRQLLHPPNGPFPEGRLAVRPGIFAFLPPSSSSGSLQLLDRLTRQALWQAPINQGAPTPLDFRRFPVGRYSLAMNGKELLKFYLTDCPAAQQWGAVAIYVGGAAQASYLPANCQSLTPQGEIRPETFTISLDSRKTIWRYYIIDRAGKQEFGHYELTAATKRPAVAENSAALDLQFLRMPQTATVDGRQAWVFESQSPLPLLLSPSSVFSLSLRPNGNGKRGGRPIPLPYARPSLARKEGAKSLCSEVFVYV